MVSAAEIEILASLSKLSPHGMSLVEGELAVDMPDREYARAVADSWADRLGTKAVLESNNHTGTRSFRVKGPNLELKVGWL